MLDEERIILMTKMASYEQRDGKKNMAIGNYFRSDYITIQVLKAVCGATVAYLIAFALYIFYDFEVFMQDIYKMDLLAFAKNALMYYAITVIAYGALSYVVYTVRYAMAKKSLRNYYQSLKKLNSMYEDS